MGEKNKKQKVVSAAQFKSTNLREII